MLPRARLALMGTLELHRSGAPVTLPAGVQRLLAFTALQAKPLARTYVAGHLWLDSSEARAAASLRSALWRLHRVAGDVIWADARELGLASWIEVDVHAMTALARDVLAGRGRVPPRLAAELIASDDVLPDWYDDWVESDRERFRQIRLHALEVLCEQLTAQQRFGEALQAGLAALRAEPLRESAHRAMIGMHLAQGNLGEAVRQYETCERLMSDELGVLPSQQTSALIDEGLAARGGRSRRGAVTGQDGRPRRGRRSAALRPLPGSDRRAA